MFYYLKLNNQDVVFQNVETLGLSKEKEATIIGMLDVAKALTLAPPSPERDTEYAIFMNQAVLMTEGLFLERGEETIDLSTASYACAWDGLSPYVITLFGVFPGEISYMGWPQTDVPPSPQEMVVDEQG